MYVFGNYRIRFDGDNKPNQECAAWLSNELGIAVNSDSETNVEEDATHNHVEDLWDWLEPFVTRHPDVSVVLEGYVDGSSGSGEFEDFRIEAKEGS